MFLERGQIKYDRGPKYICRALLYMKHLGLWDVGHGPQINQVRELTIFPTLHKPFVRIFAEWGKGRIATTVHLMTRRSLTRPCHIQIPHAMPSPVTHPEWWDLQHNTSSIYHARTDKCQWRQKLDIKTDCVKGFSRAQEASSGRSDYPISCISLLLSTARRPVVHHRQTSFFQ